MAATIFKLELSLKVINTPLRSLTRKPKGHNSVKMLSRVMFLVCQMTFMMFKKYAKSERLRFSGSREKWKNLIITSDFLSQKGDNLFISHDSQTKITAAQAIWW